MVKKHISRDYSGHKKEVIRPDEYIMFECFSYDHYYTRVLNVDSVRSINTTHTSLRSYNVLRSNNGVDFFTVSFDYTVPERATYRVDVVYEQSNIMEGDTDPAFNDDLVGSYSVKSATFTDEDDILFDGQNHALKRITLFFDLNPDTYSFDFEIPPNCYFMGAIVRKILYYSGDNVDSAGTNLQFTKADLTSSDMCKSSELTVTIGYDDALEYPASPSGFYIDYMDECNLYVKDTEENIIQIFGGYVSSIQEDDDRTQLTIHCADRLQGGENKYVLAELAFKRGTRSFDTNEYTDDMEISFENYAQALKYLCSCYEVTLDSNIDDNYLVGGEKYHEGFIIDYGKRNEKLSVSAVNGIVENNQNFVTLRNQSDASKEQVFTIFDYTQTSKEPIKLNSKGNDVDNNYGWMHITYGMGEAVHETEKKIREKVAAQSYTTTAYESGANDSIASSLPHVISIKFGKCGVSSDKKYLMAIGWESKHKNSKTYPYGTYFKSVFWNYCPYCKEWGILRWNWRGKCLGRKSVHEGEITCTKCDNDFNITDGYKKITGSKLQLIKAADTVKSSKKELNKLLSGNMEWTLGENKQVDPDEVFKNIAKICSKYKYDAKSGSTAAYLRKHHKGDVYAFNDLIFSELTKYGIVSKIVENPKKTKCSVLYKNKKNEWTNFPYRKYNFNSKLSAIPNAKSATVKAQNNVGGTIGQIKKSSTTSKIQTRKKTYKYGYDVDNPFKAYLKIGFSTTTDPNAKVYYVYPSFTLNANDSAAVTGLDTFWINNATRESTVHPNLVKFIKSSFLEVGDSDIYLRTIQFITPKNNENWYTSDDSVADESSCKLNLYQIVFNDQEGVNPSDLNCCGKAITDVFTEIVGDANYVVFMDYAKHRCDDKVNFNVVDQSTAKFRAEEGDNNNILKWGNINYTPVSKMHNRSVVVYKSTDNMYYYVDTIEIGSILNYEEQISLQSENEQIGEKQAYYVARNNNDFNPNQSYTYSVTVPGYPNVHLKDLVEVVSDKRKLNAVEVLEAITVNYDIGQIPRIRTELSLGELPDDIMVSNSLKQLRESTKKNTIFGATATPNSNKSVYTWDK